MPDLDVITIGRSSVDLYGAQVGGRLEDMASFQKYIGGSPTNMAAGTARLGLKSAVITRVGDEHMGRFVREQLQREGVCVDGVITDPERLTALVILGIRDEEQFPLIFYRENCADMALCEDDIDPAFIERAQCVTATGTHLSHPKTAAAVIKSLELARQSGGKTALDIDYRPNLWGLAGHGDGEERFIESAAVTKKLQTTLHLFDLIVGTEEEFHIAGGSTDTLEALSAVRALSSATLVCKRGPMGAVAFDGDIPDALDKGLSGPGFPIEIFNVLGAGDGFMSGLLRGWLTGNDWPTTLTWANACGALAVSRHGCAPAYPSWEELQWFLENGSEHRALRKDEKLEHIHWATNRRALPADITIVDTPSSPSNLQDWLDRQDRHVGIIADWNCDREIFYQLVETPVWLGRKVSSLDEDLSQWPVLHTAVCGMDDYALADIGRLFRNARRCGLEIALDLGADDSRSKLATALETGIFADWWIVEKTANRQDLLDLIKRHDPWCRGLLVN